MKSYKIGVLAPIPKDYIVTHNLEEIQKFGCATYTAIALVKLFGDNDTIIPVTHVKKVDEAAIKAVLSHTQTFQPIILLLNLIKTMLFI